MKRKWDSFDSDETDEEYAKRTRDGSLESVRRTLTFAPDVKSPSRSETPAKLESQEVPAIGVGLLCSQEDDGIDEAAIERSLLSKLDKPATLKDIQKAIEGEVDHGSVPLDVLQDIVDISSEVVHHEIPTTPFIMKESDVIPSWVPTAVYSKYTSIDEESDALPRMRATSLFQSVLVKIDNLTS